MQQLFVGGGSISLARKTPSWAGALASRFSGTHVDGFKKLLLGMRRFCETCVEHLKDFLA